MESSGTEPGPARAPGPEGPPGPPSPAPVSSLVTRTPLCLKLSVKPPELSVASCVKRGCYGLNCVSPNDVDALTPGTYECDLIQKSGLCK